MMQRITVFTVLSLVHAIVIVALLPSCPTGYTAVNTTCIDIDECLLDNGGCDQTCVNTNGSFHCACQNSSVLYPNNSTCTSCGDICEYTSLSIRCEFMLTSETTSTDVMDRCLMAGIDQLTLAVYPLPGTPQYTVPIDLSGYHFTQFSVVSFQETECTNIRNRIVLASSGTAYTALSYLNVIGCFDEASLHNFARAFPRITAIKLQSILMDGSTLVGFWEPFPDLTGIVLSLNNINRLEGDMFRNLSQIEQLVLNGNSIDSLENNTFSHLLTLKRIELDYNNINLIHSFQFTNMPLLETIQIQNNSLTSLPNTAFEQCPRLRDLIVTGNQFLCICDLAWTSTVSSLYGVNFGAAVCAYPPGSSQLIVSSELYAACPGDRQECFDSSINCDCVNTEASFYCQCPIGFELVGDNLIDCFDIDECNRSVDICAQTCNNTIGSYSCTCTSIEGFPPDQCIDTKLFCIPTFPEDTYNLTVVVGGDSSSLVLPVHSFPSRVVCSISESGYSMGDIQVCGNGWRNCTTLINSNFMIVTEIHNFTFFRCRFHHVTMETKERNFVIAFLSSGSPIFSQWLDTSANELFVLGWDVSGECQSICSHLNISSFFQSHPDINILTSVPYDLNCSILPSIYWFSFSYYVIKINFPLSSFFEGDYMIRIENHIFGSTTQNFSITFPRDLYCQADFQFGVLWGVTPLGNMAKLKCSDLLPGGGSALNLSRYCDIDGKWSDVKSECYFIVEPTSVTKLVLFLSVPHYFSSILGSLCPDSSLDTLRTALSSSVSLGGAGNYTETFLISSNGMGSFSPLPEGLIDPNCYSQHWTSEVRQNTSFCQCQTAVEDSRVFICTEQACNCTVSGCDCSQMFAGDGVYCSPDSDEDSFPMVDLPCSGPRCTGDNCMEHNPTQEDCNGDLIGDACQQICPSEMDPTFNLTWPCTLNGTTATVGCGESGQQATRYCEGADRWSSMINTFNCTSASYANLRDSNTTDALRRLSTLIEREKPVYSGDFDIAVNVLSDNVNKTEGSDQTERVTVLNDTLTVINQLIDSDVVDVLNQTESQSPVAEDLIAIADTLGANFLLQNQSIRYDFSNLHFQTMSLGRGDFSRNPISLEAENLPFEGEDGQKNTVEITIPTEEMQTGDIGIVFFVKRNIGTVLFRYSHLISLGMIPFRHFNDFRIISPLISAQVLRGDSKVSTFNGEPIKILAPIRMMGTSSSYRKLSCVFLNVPQRNIDEAGHSTWLDRGVEDNLISESQVQCLSQHLTSFAVLAAINGLENQESAITIVSYIGVGLSIICLSLCIFLYLAFAHDLLKQAHHYTHFNLILALLFLFILFSAGLELPYRDDFGDYVPCKVASGLLQYFVLCVFTWMLAEGTLIFILMQWPFHQFTYRYALLSLFSCWFVPAIYVAAYTYPLYNSFHTPTQLAVNSTHRSPGYCWVQSTDGHYTHRHNLVVIVPIACVILFNIALFIFVCSKAISVYCKQRSYGKLEQSRKVSLSLLRLFVVLTPTLGFLWILGLLTLDPVSPFAWVFTILGSFQGLFVLVFVVLIRKDIRDAIVGRFRSVYNRVTSATRQSNFTS